MATVFSIETPFPSLMRLKNQGIMNWTPLFHLYLREQMAAAPLTQKASMRELSIGPACTNSAQKQSLGFADNLSHRNLVFLP